MLGTISSANSAKIDNSSLVSGFSRSAHNEFAKGYYPTHPKDIADIRELLKADFHWKTRGRDVDSFSIFDPCAGEGVWLRAMKNHARKEYKNMSDPHPCTITTTAIELDSVRFEKITGTHQKLNGSFFDINCSGTFSQILLNPPYNRQDNQILDWIKKSERMLSSTGMMILIIPDYEYARQDIQDFIAERFSFIHAFKSANYSQFKQVIIFLSKAYRNRKDCAANFSWKSWALTDSNFGLSEFPTIKEYIENKNGYSRYLPIKPCKSKSTPFLTSKDLGQVYQDCELLLDKVNKKALGRIYPAGYDTEITPLASLRSAHAIQLAAMNSQIEAVTINGVEYLAKFMITQTPETYDDPDAGTKTLVYKPTIESFLLNKSGELISSKNLKIDNYELNAKLTGILLNRLSLEYKPVHAFGEDNDFLKQEVSDLGLMVPQAEAVRALYKGYNQGAKALGCRANTGTGKTFVAKSLHYLLASERTLFTTEPHLCEQIKEEYKNETFPLHMIESWDDVKRLAKEKPVGMYVLAYTRIRMHPKYRIASLEKSVIDYDDAGKPRMATADVCPDCFHVISEKLKKSEKTKCAHCGAPLYSYVPENSRPTVPSFKRWISSVEAGQISHIKTENKQLPYIKHLKKIGFDFGVFDEAHNAANGMSNQGTAFIRMSSKCARSLILTATLTNGYAKSLFNILWGMDPQTMEADGWSRKDEVQWQAKFGAFKQVMKTDDGNRHGQSTRVTTSDAPGVSPAVLKYTLPLFVNMDSKDFTDMPPTDRQVIICDQAPEVDEAYQQADKILQDATDDPDQRLAVNSVKTAAFIRLPDSFRHYSYDLTLRGHSLGEVSQIPTGVLLDKEEKFIKETKEALARNEYILVYTGNTQKVDMRPVLYNLLKKYCPEATVDILTDNIAPKNIVAWFKKSTARIVIASFKRCGTGLNLPKFNNIFWYDYTEETRKALQSDGRPRRVNTCILHREMFGEVRPIHYRYFASGPIQAGQISYTLEKQMVAQLTEGETPDIDPADCSCGDQSFASLIAKGLKTGHFDFQDPSILLKRMSSSENSAIDKGNLAALQNGANTKTNYETNKTTEPKTIVVAPVPTMENKTSQPEQLNLFGEWAA